MDRFETFTGSILELSRYVQKLKEIEMKPFGLRANHVMCLYHLGKNPQGLTVTQVAESCKEDKAAVSRCLSQLVERGLVQGDFPTDKRSYRTMLTLTDAGRELVEKIYQRVDAAMAGGGTGLTEQQREIFYTAMETIIDNLSRYIASRGGVKGTFMEKIRIITDSGSDICQPYPKNLTVLPLTIHFGQEEYRDGVTIDHKTFYEKLLSGKELPTTSLIPPGQFQQAFEQARQAGETVIAIVLSSKLSGTCQSAILAADGFENVYVVDSLNATLGEQILVKYALQLVEQGLSAGEIVAELERAKSHVNLMGLPDTLEYLHRGGRVSKTVAVLGGALSIKPVLRIADGVVVMIGKARGSRNGNNYLIQEVSRSGVDFSKPLCLGYTGLSDELLQRYIADSRALWEGKVDSLPISTVGATIGTHVGPGAVIVAFFDGQGPQPPAAPGGNSHGADQ